MAILGCSLWYDKLIVDKQIPLPVWLVACISTIISALHLDCKISQRTANGIAHKTRHSYQSPAIGCHPISSMPALQQVFREQLKPFSDKINNRFKNIPDIVIIITRNIITSNSTLTTAAQLSKAICTNQQCN